MKRFIASIAILLSIAVFVTYLIFSVNNITNEFLQKIDNITYSCEKESFETVKLMTIDFIDFWKEKEKFLIMFVRHEHLDQVSTIVAELEEILESDMSIFKSKCSQLIEAIEHLHHSEFPLIHK